MTNIFVGNLPYNATENDLEAAFTQYGTVERVSVIRDRESGQSRGFGFVEMPNAGEAENAINGLNGRELNGRTLNVNEARPREERSFGGGGGNGGRGGNGGGGGFRRGRGRTEPRW
jgi:RNA recognition motif-containing protein